MRRWYKSEIVPKSRSSSMTLDRSFDEHQRAMGGYNCVGYDSTGGFFKTHLETSPRHLCYQRFLAAHLPKDGRVLSIASGRAANEMRLVVDGYRVVCSDLDPVCPGESKRLFPGYEFMKWDVLNDPLPPERFDAVMCLSFIYLLDEERLRVFFGRVSELLKPDGVFVLDSAGSSDAWLANLLHEVYLPCEAWLVCGIRNVADLFLHGGSDGLMVVRRKHHGYRYNDREIVAAAAEKGLMLLAVERMDSETELTRSYLYRHGARRVPPLRRGLLAVGRAMPYVRMFAFRRAA
ncbi:MAG: class I SAM-dependent methyltransferase [Phycisphaerales bacterium]|nr:class I SAM-dependent methyltransferase [Phycisphaerales bacterium]